MTALEDASVLLVDDESDFLELVEFEFERCGCRTHKASSGKEARACFDSGSTDLVITDIRMNDGDGIELLTHIKKVNLHLPPVMLVSGVEDILPRVAYSLGAEALFQKPCRLSDLLETARRLLLPPMARWNRLEEPPTGLHARNRLLDTSVASLVNAVDLGRGGLSVNVAGRQPRVGSCLAFRAKCEATGLDEIDGTGTIRWVETDPAAGQFVCGIEIDYLTDETRRPFCDWIMNHNIVPFIPPGTMPGAETHSQPWRMRMYP
ncbi:MAG: response regulator [Candidatus Hydrogenedentes bacterium]|nr:response regulator [Candidatus Hydrogenedentota bacterium]